MILKKVSRNKYLRWITGVMGIVAIPLLAFNLYVAPPVDKVFAFSELAMFLLMFSTFAAMVDRNSRK